ncbi:MAG: NYN domain-containing protein [Campylobacterales bacterium]|nr:NYN domain-containing protein [Campylobacterales bacterium]
MVKNKKVALFIDCENVSYKYIDDIISDLAKLGEVHIRKAYGDWKNDNLKGWDEIIFEYSLEPIYQPRYSNTKNASDIKMTVDIMKTLCINANIDFIALATSDSDFTPLVTEVKSQGIQVVGFGEEKTSDILKKACTEFIKIGKVATKKSDLVVDRKLINRIKHAINYTKDDDGWALVSDFGIYFKNNYASSANNYGNYKSWSELLLDMPSVVEVQYIQSANNRKVPIVRIV